MWRRLHTNMDAEARRGSPREVRAQTVGVMSFETLIKNIVYVLRLFYPGALCLVLWRARELPTMNALACDMITLEGRNVSLLLLFCYATLTGAILYAACKFVLCELLLRALCSMLYWSVRLLVKFGLYFFGKLASEETWCNRFNDWCESGERRAGGVEVFLPLRFARDFEDEAQRGYLTTRWSWVHMMFLTAGLLLAFVTTAPDSSVLNAESRCFMTVSIMFIVAAIVQCSVLWRTERQHVRDTLSRRAQSDEPMLHEC